MRLAKLVFELLALKAKFKGVFLTGNVVSVVICCVKKMVITNSTKFRHLFYTVSSTDIAWQYRSIKSQVL